MVAQTFLLAADPGYRHGLLRAPSAGIPLRGAIVVVAPLTEELNRSRRMIALGAERLAGEGFAGLEFDYRGCGDSSDDFGTRAGTIGSTTKIAASAGPLARHTFATCALARRHCCRDARVVATGLFC